jgi:general secretion pathway protein J
MAQWGADLDALVELPHTMPLDWDGRALRMTRRHAADPTDGVLVVAWGRAVRDGTAQWLRWQSAPVRTRREWTDAWTAAGRWAQNPSQKAQVGEVALVPLEQWQIYYFRGNAWSNPYSSADAPAAETSKGPPVPDGVRLVLTVAPPHPLFGVITRDWARPTLTVDSP